MVIDLSVLGCSDVQSLFMFCHVMHPFPHLNGANLLPADLALPVSRISSWARTADIHAVVSSSSQHNLLFDGPAGPDDAAECRQELSPLCPSSPQAAPAALRRWVPCHPPALSAVPERSESPPQVTLEAPEGLATLAPAMLEPVRAMPVPSTKTSLWLSAQRRRSSAKRRTTSQTSRRACLAPLWLRLRPRPLPPHAPSVPPPRVPTSLPRLPCRAVSADLAPPTLLLLRWTWCGPCS